VALISAAWGRKNTGLEVLGDLSISEEWNSCAP
jgi:hypothetical protein